METNEQIDGDPAPEEPGDSPDEVTTGPAGSEAEREAARHLTRKLRDRGLAVVGEPAYFRPATGLNRSLHALLAIGGGIVALQTPLLGALICLAAAFSWYADRALVTPVLGRLMPRRPTQNVLSPPPGPAWEQVRLIIGTGYDQDFPSPFSSWLGRRLTGVLTVDRLTLWAGMLPVFLSAMLRLAEFEGVAVGVLQLVGSAVLLGVVASEIDRRLTGLGEPSERDLEAADCLVGLVDSLDDGMIENGEVAIAFFGAEHSAASGAREFFKRLSVTSSTAPRVLGLVAPGRGGEGTGPAVTVREGDVAVTRMTPVELEPDSDAGPLPTTILRRESVASMARRRGLEAVTVVGTGDDLPAGAVELIELLSRGDEES